MNWYEYEIIPLIDIVEFKAKTIRKRMFAKEPKLSIDLNDAKNILMENGYDVGELVDYSSDRLTNFDDNKLMANWIFENPKTTKAMEDELRKTNSKRHIPKG